MRKITAAVAIFALLATPATALAGYGGGGGARSGGGGGGGFKSSSGGSKSAGGSIKSATGQSVPKTSSAGAKAYSTSKSSLKQPSSGPVKQPAPLTRMLPPTPPRPAVGSNRTFQAPAGHAYGRDQRFISTHREYANPYYGHYYGSFDSPLFYMWAFGMMDNDNGNNPKPIQADEGEVAQITPAEFKLLAEALKPAEKTAEATP